MPSIRIERFGGMKPKNARGQGDVSLASFASDVNLEHGSLRPWRYPSLELETDSDFIGAMYKEECCWLTSDNHCASFTRGDTDCNRIFSTGVMPWPAYATITGGSDRCCESECEVEWCRLGVPKPVNGVTVLETEDLRPTPPAADVSTGDYDCTVQGNYRVDDYLGEVEEGEPDPIDEYCELQGTPEASGPYRSDYGKQVYREPRSYFYTFVNEYGEEGTPSDPTEIVDVDVDGSTRLGFNIPPMTDGYCDPTFIRIYRGLPSSSSTMTEGFRSSIHGEVNPFDFDTDAAISAAFFLVDEIPYREGNFTYDDDVAPDLLGEANTSYDNTPPLDCLEQIEILENGSLVACTGKELWFSEPYKYHSWNCFMNLDDCIINFKLSGLLIFVATDGFPYVITAAPMEDAECLCCRKVNKLLEPAPIVSALSMVETNSGVIWATNTGLVKIFGNEMRVLTHPFMSESDWQEYMPHQLKGAFYKGKYFGFNKDKGFIFDLTDGVYADEYMGEGGKFTELSLTPDCVHRTDQNILYMSFDGDIYRWDAANTDMPYTWRSKLHVEGGLRNYSIMKVVFEDWLRAQVSPKDATMRFYADDKLMFERKVNCSRPFRLPKGFDALNFQIEITSTEPVREIHMATSKVELISLNNS